MLDSIILRLLGRLGSQALEDFTLEGPTKRIEKKDKKKIMILPRIVFDSHKFQYPNF